MARLRYWAKDSGRSWDGAAGWAWGVWSRSRVEGRLASFLVGRRVGVRTFGDVALAEEFD